MIADSLPRVRVISTDPQEGAASRVSIVFIFSRLKAYLKILTSDSDSLGSK